jgi:hypothetical protein
MPRDFESDASLDPRLNSNIASLFFKVKKSHKKVLSDDSQCAICLEELVPEDSESLKPSYLSLPCDSQRRHSFHEVCL